MKPFGGWKFPVFNGRDRKRWFMVISEFESFPNQYPRKDSGNG